MRGFWLVPAIGLLWAAPVAAQVIEPPAPPVQGGHTADLTVGLGFGGYTSKLGRLSSKGLSWSLRGNYNLSRFFAVELSYDGIATNASAVNAGGATILENQVTAGVKAGLPIPLGRGFLRPYAFAGAGYGYISLSTNGGPTTPTTSIPSESAGAFPFGGGLAFEFGRGPVINEFLPAVILDARYTYSVLTAGEGNLWNVLFEVGGRIPSY